MFLFKRNGTYYLQYIDSYNQIKRISTKKRIKSEALKFLTDFKNNLKKEPAKKIIFLKDFKKEYLEHNKLSNSESYCKRSIEPAFNKFIEFTGNLELVKINQRLAEKFLLSVFSKHKSGAALYYRVLKAAFNKAIDWNYLIENPFLKVKLPKRPKSNPVFINSIELQMIIVHTNNKTLKELFRFAFFTGMRRNEIINLKWNAVDFNLKIIRIKNTKSFTTKSKKERVIPMNKTVFNLLKEIYPKVIDINRDEFVFRKHAGVKLDELYVSKSFKKAVRDVNKTKAVIDEQIHFHSLRHSFASNLVQKGTSLYVIKELLGHEDLKTTQIYSHLQNENLFDAVNLLESDEKLKKNLAQ